MRYPAILIPCLTVGLFAVWDELATAEPQHSRGPRQRRRLQQEAPVAAPSPAKPQQQQQQQQQFMEDATIVGSVFEDLNRNGRYEPSLGEGAVQGAVAKLFSCSTGSRLGIARTGADGSYDFLIPAGDLPFGSTGCYYVQFNVNGYLLPNAVFTTPRNGETSDIYLKAGESAVFVDAGAYGVTPSPTTWEWTTYQPTFPGGARAPSPAPYIYIAVTPAPNDIAGEGHEWVGEAITFETAEPSPTTAVMVPLPLPSDTVVMPTMAAPTLVAANPTESAESSPVVAATLPLPSDALAPPASSFPATVDPMASIEISASAPVPIVSGMEEEGSTTVGDEDPEIVKNPEAGEKGPTGGISGNDRLGEGETLLTTPLEKNDPGGEELSDMMATNDDKPGKQQEDQDQLQDNEDLIKPSEEIPGKPIAEHISIDSGVLKLQSTVRVRLDGVECEMDADARSMFVNVCEKFLKEQLEIATPPVTDLGCSVARQKFVERCRRLKGGHRGVGVVEKGLRALQGGNNMIGPAASGGMLVVDIKVTGEVEKTKSVQEPEDVKFDELLAGTFNVQGYQFAEALKKEEKKHSNEQEETTDVEATISTKYFQHLGELRAVDRDNAESQEEEANGGSDMVFTDGIITAIVVGGLVLILLIAMMNRKKHSHGLMGHVGKSSGANASGAMAAGAKTGSAKEVASGSRLIKGKGRPGSQMPQSTSPTVTDSTHTSATPSPKTSKPTPQLTIAKSIDSEDVEVGLASFGPAPQTSSPGASSKRCPPRVRRDVVAPAGKLGMMVANTSRHGPAVHTVRPGSPMVGRLFVGDVIVAMDGVDTADFTAEEITRVMKDTVGRERKISVLSAYQ